MRLKSHKAILVSILAEGWCMKHLFFLNKSHLFHCFTFVSFLLSYQVYSLTYFPTIHWFMYFDICLLIIIKIQFAPKWPQYSLTYFLNCVSSQHVHIANMLQMLGVRSWMGPWIFEVHVRRHSESHWNLLSQEIALREDLCTRLLLRNLENLQLWF